jgi:endonuclease YncB( thermonuclease family)
MAMFRSIHSIAGHSVAGLVLVAAACWAPPAAGELRPGATARAVAVVDGDTLVLEDGREVRLVGIQAPKLPLGRPDFQAWPLADRAKAALERLTLGRRLKLSFGGRALDRHGRMLAHLHDDAGQWIQGEMLRQGLARVYSFADNRAKVAEMLALERAARASRRGIWSHPYYRVLKASETPKFIGGFQLVEGRVLDASVIKGRVYLNFGTDWRTDFTVSMAPARRRLFEAEGIEVRDYAGRRVRVRGWLKSYNGPMIEATHPEQIEVLGE